jgi:hypothetical protein
MARPRKGGRWRRSNTVDLSSEWEEIRRRQYHARIRRELQERGVIKDTGTVEEALEEAAPRLEQKGWKVTRKEQ